jgi:transcriptional regulator of arginine metabolism
MVVSIEHNGHLVVVRTRVGRAQAVGLELDALRHPDLLGTLAGDDTVLVIPRSVGATAALARRLRELADLTD